MFPNNSTRAAAYAAYKELERMLKADGDLPPGFFQDVSGTTIEITIPKGTTITRDKGNKGNGTIEKAATQNLYGWAILYECHRVAAKFKQHKRLIKILMKIVRRAVNRAISSEDAFRELMPRQAEEIAKLKATIKVPKREESTPRMINRENAKIMPTVIIHPKKQRAA